jgi:hypothetical protein
MPPLFFLLSFPDSSNARARARVCRLLVFSEVEFADLEFRLSGSWPFKLLD